LKDTGDKLTYGLRMLLTGDGQLGDNTLEGNEESLIFYSDSILIDQLRHATRSSGKMSEQRVPYNMREEARLALSDWFADRIDCAVMNHLAGNAGITDKKWTGANTTVAPSTGRKVFAGTSITDEASLSAAATDNFTLTLIDKAVVTARTASPLIKPVKINGEDKFVCFIHPYQHYQLRSNTGTAQWMDIQKAAMTGGQISKNPIYTGALGEYNGVVLHESTRVPWGTAAANTAHPKCAVGTANVARAVFCGAQAAVLCTGKGTSSGVEASWTEELFDRVNTLVAIGRKAYRKLCEFGGTLGIQTIPSYA
jgi:N4-gp56 family major capsid protein